MINILGFLIICRMPHINGNGPAVGLSKRYPTQHPSRVLIPRASGARNLSRCKEGMAHFLPSLSLHSLGEGGPVQILIGAGAIAVQV